MQNEIVTGIVGYGLSGRVFHAPFIHIHPGFRLKSVVERNSALSGLRYPYVQVVSDYHQLIDDPEIELIVVAVPNIFHYQMVKDSLEAGKHVVVEKPFTPTSEEGLKLIKISEKTGKKILVFHNRRWDGDFKTLKKITGQKLVGEIMEFEAHFDRFTPVRTRAAWRDEPKPASGVLYDLGPHLIDQALVLFGLPHEIYADIRYQRKNTRVDDYFHIELYYDSFKAILKAGVFVKEGGPRYILHGSKGSFIKYGIDPQEAQLKSGMMPVGESWGTEDPELYGLLHTEIGQTIFKGKITTERGNYGGFYQNVYETLISGNEMEVTPHQAVNVISVIEHAFKSHAEKSRIKFTY